MTFNVTKDIGGAARKVHLVGDFNDWDSVAQPMKRKKDGSFRFSLDLEQGRKYQFLYLIDGTIWEQSV
jgi:1,4-alpha-glucan branching enzyme